MKVAITGATGFIGRHVRNALAKTDHAVVVVVRKIEKAGEISANEAIVEADLSQERTDWFKYFGSPDALIHLAWGGLPNYLDEYHVDTELPMQIKFLKALINSGLKKLVVAGTCYEYGITSGGLIESQDTIPNTPYGVAKDRLRKSLLNLMSEANFELTWTRIFYPYGDGQSEMSIYSQLRTAILGGDTEFKMGSGKQVLDFISVERVASVLSLLATRCAGAGIVNIGSSKPQSVFDFVKDQIRAQGAQLEPMVGALPDRNFESQSFWADETKLLDLLTRADVNYRI